MGKNAPIRHIPTVHAVGIWRPLFMKCGAVFQAGRSPAAIADIRGRREESITL